MTTLIVQAHPLENSYNAALLDAVTARHRGARVIRLAQGDRLSAEACTEATSLVAVYPTWWGSIPAVFLAALAQTLGPWIDGDAPVGTSPLRSAASITVVTSHGSSKLINRLQGEPGKQLWKRTVLRLCAPGATFVWQSLYRLDRATAADRANFLTRVGGLPD